MTTNQALFFSNAKNKKEFIKMLPCHLENNGIEVASAVDDADSIIIQWAMKKANTRSNVVVIGEDIDLLVILTALTPRKHEIFFLKPAKGPINDDQLFSSRQSLHSKMKSSIMFIQAFSGCDSTSSFYNHGKTKLYNLLYRDKNLRKIVNVYNKPNASMQDICTTGRDILLRVYNAPPTITSLNEYRFSIYKKKARSAKAVDMRSLCPTEDAADQHLKRVYSQVQYWHGRRLNIPDWGWNVENNLLEPVQILKAPAPAILINNIFCRCKKKCGAKCTCKKLG